MPSIHTAVILSWPLHGASSRFPEDAIGTAEVFADSLAMTAGISPRPSKSPRIVLVIGSLEGGGAERVISDMANYWAGKNWHVTLATWSGSKIKDFYPLAPDIQRIWLEVQPQNGSLLSKLNSNIARTLKLRRVLQKLKPNAVLSFIDRSNVLTILATLGLGHCVIVSERINPKVNFELSRAWRILRKISYRWANQVVAQTQDAAEWIECECGVNVVVIPNSLRSLPEVSFERKPLIVAVGRLSKQKGFDLLIRAFAKISSRFHNWRLAIIGEGSERSTLIELSRQLGIQDRIAFVGQVRDVETWMAIAGLVVQPSRFEGFPNVVLESMGMGATVVATDCFSGPSDLIQDGINGRLVPVEDVDKLVQVIEQLILQPAVRENLGREALKVRRRFQQDLIMSDWEVLFF
jgi:glycosyltransferase involved in cell wall biosynthesis